MGPSVFGADLVQLLVSSGRFLLALSMALFLSYLAVVIGALGISLIRRPRPQPVDALAAGHSPANRRVLRRPSGRHARPGVQLAPRHARPATRSPEERSRWSARTGPLYPSARPAPPSITRTAPLPDLQDAA